MDIRAFKLKIVTNNLMIYNSLLEGGKNKMKVKGVRLHGAHDIRLEEFELPEIQEDEILVKVVSDSICMSTWKMVQAGKDHKRVPENVAEHPVIIGHEFTGDIVKVGSKWKNQFHEGKKFAQQPAIPGQMESPGYSYEFFGGAATYCIFPNDVIEKGCIWEYDGDSYFEASLGEPMSCCIGGYHSNYHTEHLSYEHKMGTLAGGNILILGGCGPMGLGAISYGLAFENKPKRIVVIDINDVKIARAKEVISEASTFSSDPDQNKLGFFRIRFPKHLLSGRICSILSEKSLRIFSLEFSGLHYCLFVKVLCCCSVLLNTQR